MKLTADHTRIAKKPSRQDLADWLIVDELTGPSKGVFTARRSFFYEHGGSEDKVANMITGEVAKKFPGWEAEIVDKGKQWRPFKGGDSVRKGSHWWVKFRLVPSQTETPETPEATE